MACLEPWTQEYNFLKFPCESVLMDFSMECKSFPLIAYYKIQSLKLIMQKIKMILKESRSSFLWVLITSKIGLHPTLYSGIKFPKISLG